ncbi:MAG: DNA polymerase I [Suipraeoptans sp.]
MSEKILLIDGHSILNRAFFGIPTLTNSEGLHTNAVYVFLNILFKVIDEEKPDYLTVAFDVSAPTFRHEMYKEYKGTRKPMADELREQVPVIKEVLASMGVTVVEKAGLEADDILGTLSVRCELKEVETVILSGDKDLLQLATDKVKIKIPKTSKGKTEVFDYYAKDVVETYKVTPKEFIDVKALMGDTSDNIPGVPSIGEKTATNIIVQYKDIENAYKHVDELKPPRAGKALGEFMDQARLSKELATINVAAEFPFDLDEARLSNLYTKEAHDWFVRLQFKNLMSRFDLEPEKHDIEDNFFVYRGVDELTGIVDEVKKSHDIGISIVKDVGIGMCVSKKKVYAFVAENAMEYELIRHNIEELVNSGSSISLFNIKEIRKDIEIKDSNKVFDNIIAAYLLNPLKNDYTFVDVAGEQLGIMIDDKCEIEKRLCFEAYTSYKVKDILAEKLKEQNMLKLFTDIEMPLSFTLDNMEKEGVRVDAQSLKEFGNELGEKIKTVEKNIYEDTGEEFNINSPKQLGVILFEKLELPHGKKTKSGYSTAAGVLEKLAPDYPVVNKILEYRQLSKLKSTYADGLANFISDDGRIHGKFNQTITATGRISSTDPNLQNIPIRMELGRQIRKVFIPDADYVFLDADYSQIELRVLAHYSGDEHLINAYKEQKDIHAITASQVFHVPFDEVTPLLRRNAKAVNFGIVYGISSFGLSEDLSITRKEASEYIENYFKTYPGIKKFLDKQVADAKETGYVTTLYNRRRPVPELSSSNFMQRSFGERVAMNAPIQGSAADIMKIAMIKVDDEIRNRKLKSRLVLQVHDELLIETHKDEVEEVKNILIKNMQNAVTLKVPLEIDIHKGDNWYEAK